MTRYVLLNPVRAGMVNNPADWLWRSYRAKRGTRTCCARLAVDGLRAQFAEQRGRAQTRYTQFVAEGIKALSPWLSLKGQVVLGDAQFVHRMQVCMRADARDDVQIPVVQRRPLPASSPEIERGAENRNAAVVMAYATGAYSCQ